MKQYVNRCHDHREDCMCDACRRQRELAGHTWLCKPTGNGCGGITCKPVDCAEEAPCDCGHHRPGHPAGCTCPLCRPCPEECGCHKECPQPCRPDCRPDCRPNCRPDCDPCRKKKTFPPHGFLLPRIIASGREWQRRAVVHLCVAGLPPCAEPPFTLLSVSQCGDMPDWEQVPSGGSRQLRLHVVIPVSCQVRDKNGCVYTGHATVEMDAALQLSMPLSECWRNAMVVLPCVRLVCVPPAACEPCYDAQLEVLLEAYMTRWEPCMVGVPKPVCPDLPLYPQPRDSR